MVTNAAQPLKRERQGSNKGLNGEEKMETSRIERIFRECFPEITSEKRIEAACRAIRIEIYKTLELHTMPDYQEPMNSNTAQQSKFVMQLLD